MYREEDDSDGAEMSNSLYSSSDEEKNYKVRPPLTVEEKKNRKERQKSRRKYRKNLSKLPPQQQALHSYSEINSPALTSSSSRLKNQLTLVKNN